MQLKGFESGTLGSWVDQEQGLGPGRKVLGVRVSSPSVGPQRPDMTNIPSQVKHNPKMEPTRALGGGRGQRKQS